MRKRRQPPSKTSPLFPASSGKTHGVWEQAAPWPIENGVPGAWAPSEMGKAFPPASASSSIATASRFGRNSVVKTRVERSSTSLAATNCWETTVFPSAWLLFWSPGVSGTPIWSICAPRNGETVRFRCAAS